MRTLNQIASENYVEHTARDIEVMEIVRSETVADLMVKLMRYDPYLAERLTAQFWEENKRGL